MLVIIFRVYVFISSFFRYSNLQQGQSKEVNLVMIQNSF